MNSRLEENADQRDSWGMESRTFPISPIAQAAQALRRCVRTWTCRLTWRCNGRLTAGSFRFRSSRLPSNAAELRS